MEFAMIGLGKMGLPMAVRAAEDQHDVWGFDVVGSVRKEAVDAGLRVADDLGSLVERLAPPRIIWLMLPAGVAVSSTIGALSELLARDDLVVDGGNSHVRDSAVHHDLLREREIRYVDIGTSGGIWGVEHGWGLLVGANEEDYERLTPILASLAAPDGYARVGPVGTGHLTKTFHNGVQYGMMQAYAEGFELLADCPDEVDVAAVLRVWQAACSVRSWILGHLAESVQADPRLASVEPRVGQSGTGSWTVEHALERGVAVPVIALSLFERFHAAGQDGSAAERALTALRASIGGHGVADR